MRASVEELFVERGLDAGRTTILRWVQRYGRELDRRLRRHLKPANKSWRVDETYIHVSGRWCFLYRMIDSSGAAIDFLSSAIYESAIPAVKEEGTLRRRCRHRPVQFLNNVLEQDHRAIKRRVKASQGFREFRAAQRTIQGYEATNRIGKGQARWVGGSDIGRQNQKITFSAS